MLKKGCLYYIDNDYFKLINDNKLMINHGNDGKRPVYYLFKDQEYLWFVPLSSKIKKYERIKKEKSKKYGKCDNILVEELDGIKQVFLIQNAFPTLEKYVCSFNNDVNKQINIKVFKEIYDSFKNLLSLKKKGINLFFVDIDRIKKRLNSLN